MKGCAPGPCTTLEVLDIFVAACEAVIAGGFPMLAPDVGRIAETRERGSSEFNCDIDASRDPAEGCGLFEGVISDGFEGCATESKSPVVADSVFVKLLLLLGFALNPADTSFPA
jgi:hypothetical protein